MNHDVLDSNIKSSMYVIVGKLKRMRTWVTATADHVATLDLIRRLHVRIFRLVFAESHHYQQMQHGIRDNACKLCAATVRTVDN